MTRNTDKVLSIGKVETNTSVATSKIYDMVTEKCIGLTVATTKVTGIVECNMALEL